MKKSKIGAFIAACIFSLSACAGSTPAPDAEEMIYFEYSGSEKGYCLCHIGEITGLNLSNYDDSFYEIGNTPIEFKIEDESVATIRQVQGSIVNITGVSVGETVLSATVPEGKTVSVKIVVEKAVITTTTAIWTDDKVTSISILEDTYETTSDIINPVISEIREMSIADIGEVALSAHPPGITIQLYDERITEMLTLLKNVSLYEEDNSYSEYGGRWVNFEIKLNTGKEISLATLGSFFVIDRVGYKADYDACQALNMFADSVLSQDNSQESLQYSEHSAATVYCVEDDKMLYSDRIHEHIAPASLTKLLTASVALKYLSDYTIITVGSEQSLVPAGSSICYVLPGHKLELSDLLTGMLMVSGNDAAYAVAVSVARAVSGDASMNDVDAVEYFCGLMNGFAEDIGMTESHFSTPDGWDDNGQYTTAADLVVLARYALSVPVIREIVGTYTKKVVYYSGEVANWTNTNRLLDPESPYYCQSAVGMKTGTTEKAGNCLIAAIEADEKTYITVVTGCGSTEERYELTAQLIEDHICE